MSTTAPDPTAQKLCPECAETVQEAAKVCRYCGYRFDGAPGETGDRPSITIVQPPGNGLAVAALCVGIAAVLIGGAMFILFPIALGLGGIAVVLGLLGRSKAKREPAAGRRSMATWGLVLGIAALAIGVAGAAVVDDAVNEMDSAVEQLDQDLQEFDEDVEDIGTESGAPSDAYWECMGDPNTTYEECEALE